MKIESIRIKNFRMFRDVTINNLPNCCIFVGANGTGKTSLFELFRLLRDALTHDIEHALAKRGGFKEVLSRGTSEPIELELKFRGLKSTSSLVTYWLVIDRVKNRAIIKREVLKYRRGQRSGGRRHFLDFSLGRGKVITNSNSKPQEQKLISPNMLALHVFGNIQGFEIAREVFMFLKNGHFYDIKISDARKINPATGYDEHLSHPKLKSRKCLRPPLRCPRRYFKTSRLMIARFLTLSITNQ
jgi:predicted ATPase